MSISKLRHLRTANGLSQHELGIRLSLSDRTISAFECGRMVPNNRQMVDIARILGLPPEEIWPERFFLNRK